MLRSLDILIGLSVVMLVVSMAVTLVTQFFLTLVAARGRHLLNGLSDLLQQLHPGASRLDAQAVARLVLTSPAVRGMGVGPWGLGDVVHREELTKLLLDLAAGNLTRTLSAAETQAVDQLKQAMANAGIANPAQTLDNVRMFALQLEKSNPEMAADARHSIALLQEASSNYLGKINFWFDQTMDRVSSRFTFNARVWTLVSATIVALVLQLDTVSLVNKLAMDDKMREKFVELATNVQKRIDAESGGAGPAAAVAPAPVPAASAQPPAQSPAPTTAGEQTSAAAPPVAPPAAPESTPAQPAKPAATGYHYEDLEFLEAQGIVAIPTSGAQWLANFRNHRVNPGGVLVSILLLSLGAPFWYSALGKLLQLRSLLAQKDDAQRTERQTTQAPPSGRDGSGTPALPPTATGERGDLGAIG